MRRKLIKQTRAGQITIPKEFRDAIGLDPDDALVMTLNEGNRLELTAARISSPPSGSPWLGDLYDLFAPARAALLDLSEDEINAEIDAALQEVRAEKKLKKKRA